MCVVALILGMLMANMLKSVCGCKTVEGQAATSAGSWRGIPGGTGLINTTHKVRCENYSDGWGGQPITGCIWNAANTCVNGDYHHSEFPDCEEWYSLELASDATHDHGTPLACADNECKTRSNGPSVPAK